MTQSLSPWLSIYTTFAHSKCVWSFRHIGSTVNVTREHSLPISFLPVYSQLTASFGCLYGVITSSYHRHMWIITGPSGNSGLSKMIEAKGKTKWKTRSLQQEDGIWMHNVWRAELLWFRSFPPSFIIWKLAHLTWDDLFELLTKRKWSDSEEMVVKGNTYGKKKTRDLARSSPLPTLVI